MPGALLLEGLPLAGLPVSDMATSDGAFYIYVDVSHPGPCDWDRRGGEPRGLYRRRPGPWVI